jgi:hypothetical protein
MEKDFKWAMKDFDKLTLTELNSQASFLKRIDTKFLLTSSQFEVVLKDLKKDFRVLEIAENRVFDYDNVYMDSEDYLFYKQHQAGLNPRTKIRTRLYKDANLSFFEYKHKLDGITSKYRYEFPSEEHGIMTKGKKRFFEWVWQSINNWEKAPKITPSIKTRYKRITLVSKLGEERLTIDFWIKIKNLRNNEQEEIDLKNLIIVESKTLKKNCKSWEIMKAHNIPKAKACSKYSLWVVYSGLAEKYDHFSKTMEKIKEIRLETLKNRERTQNIVNFNVNSQFTKKAIETNEAIETK